MNVQSASQSGITYSVRIENESCSCKLHCGFCGACIHKYVCSCVDSAVHNTVCKHSHLVQLYEAGVTPSDSCRPLLQSSQTGVNDIHQLSSSLIEQATTTPMQQLKALKDQMVNLLKKLS